MNARPGVRAGSRAATLQTLGEVRLVDAIRTWLGNACPPSPRGIGDDCAILPSGRAGRRQLITVDPVICGRHFDTTQAPAAVAAKLLRRNLSDIAAMGGTPRSAVVALAAPASTAVGWLRRFYRGLAREARDFNVEVVGGDCAQTDGLLGIWLTLVGEAPRRPLTRTGARIGDLVFVSGTLGGSLLGRHLRFAPRLAEGRWLARRAEVHAAIDLSDGLAKDVLALVPRGAAVRIDPRHVPVSAAAHRVAVRTGRPPLEHACNDGEDYELLFAVAPNRAEALIVAWHRRFATRLSCIGRLEKRAPGQAPLHWVPAPDPGIRVRGYEHFR